MRWLATGLALLGLGFLVALNWEDFTEATGEVDWLWIAVAVLPLMAGHFVTAMLSSRSVRVEEGPVRVAAAYRILANGLMAKYIPGGIWQFVGQWSQGRTEGLGGLSTIRVWADPTLVILTVGAGWVLAFAIGLPYPVPNWLFGLGALVMFGLSWPTARHWVMARLRLGAEVSVPAREWGVEFVLASLAVIMSALHGLAVMQGVVPDSGVGFVGALVAINGAWIVGFLAFPIPGGIGVREAVLAFALLPWMGSGAAAAVAITSRLASVAADVGSGAIGLALGRTTRG